MENQIVKEGEILKNYLKGSGKPMAFYFKELNMTRQNLGHHLRKEKLEEDFALKVKDKLGLIIKDGTIFSIEKTEQMDIGKQSNTAIVSKGTGNQKIGTLALVMKLLREFDAPLAKWVANKVDGPGLDEEDVLLLEDKLGQIRKNIDTEMQEEIKLLPLNKKKKDNSQ